MHVQFSGNLYVFLISYIYIFIYIYIYIYVYVNIYKHLPLYSYVHLRLEMIYPKDPRIASNWKQSCFFQSKGLAGIIIIIYIYMYIGAIRIFSNVRWREGTTAMAQE